MASIIGMKSRKAAAQGRLNASLPALAELLGLDLPPYPVVRQSPEREAAERAEWTADLIDAAIHTLLPTEKRPAGKKAA